jgi:hypothetical protein
MRRRTATKPDAVTKGIATSLAASKNCRFDDESPAFAFGNAGIGNGGATWTFDEQERRAVLSAACDALERLTAVVDFEVFLGSLDTTLSHGSSQGRASRHCTAVGRSDRIPAEAPPVVYAVCQAGTARDAKTIWLFREQLAQASALEGCLRGLTCCMLVGCLVMGGVT